MQGEKEGGEQGKLMAESTLLRSQLQTRLNDLQVWGGPGDREKEEGLKHRETGKGMQDKLKAEDTLLRSQLQTRLSDLQVCGRGRQKGMRRGGGA